MHQAITMRWYSIVSYCAMLSISSAQDCTLAAIQRTLPAGASVEFVRSVAENASFEVPPGNLPYPISPVGLPALCATSVRVQSPMNSSFGFGLFLPNDWNGRFLAVGNGGFAGGINWFDMATGLRYGFATISTDTGHNSSVVDGTWAYQQPELVNNWGYRAMHGSVITAKQIVEQFYAKKPEYSYYSGCSTGGRQGLKEAEMFPEDFDGIIAGAPAWWPAHLQIWTTRLALNNLPQSAAHHIPPELYLTIGAEVLKQCDAQDGLTDTVISNPYECIFRAEALLCGANVSDPIAARCLTSPQIDTLGKIYANWVTTDQSFVFPHLAPGSEPGWAVWLLNTTNTPHPFGTDYIKYFLGLGPQWDYWKLDETVIALADQLDPGNSSVGFDLSGYHEKGGKVLSYHGLADSLIPAASTPYFYNQVYRTLEPKGIELDDFFRVFLVPGMGHCGGSHVSFNASWYFAGSSQAGVLGPTIHSVPGYSDAKHDVLLALMDWVENGTAPDSIIATKYANDTKHDVVSRQRPLCMYPKQAQYKGTGDPNEPDTWECRLPSDAPPDQPACLSAGSTRFSVSNLLHVIVIVMVSGYEVIMSI